MPNSGDNTHLRAILTRHAPLVVAAGLAGVLAAAIWPTLPVAWAMALIGMGTTLELISKSRLNPCGPWTLLLNLAAYGLLVCLVAGAQLSGGGQSGVASSPLLGLADVLVGAALLVTAGVLGVRAIPAGRS